jgi:cytochrome c553
MKIWLAGVWAFASLCVPAAYPAATRQGNDFESVSKLKPDAQRGAGIFGSCVACHGADGGGQVSGSVPRVAGQLYGVLVRQLVDFRNGRRWDMRMEGVATSHDVMPELQDIADVAGYVSQLDADGARGVGDGENLDAGARIYAVNCASCHGAKGEGDEARGIPRLAGQHAGYLSRQLYDAVDGRRPALTASHGKRFEKLDFQQVRGIADWLSRVGWQPAPN